MKAATEPRKPICGARHISTIGGCYFRPLTVTDVRTYEGASKFVTSVTSHGAAQSGFSRSREARAAPRGARRLISHTLTAGQLNTLQAVLGITRPGLCMRGKKKKKNGCRVHLEVISQCYPGTTCTQFPPSFSRRDGANTSSPKERKRKKKSPIQ